MPVAALAGALVASGDALVAFQFAAQGVLLALAAARTSRVAAA
jgi:hypothetical protein